MDQEASGSLPLFAVFLFSMISLVLVPYTLHKLFSSEQDETEVCIADCCNVHCIMEQTLWAYSTLIDHHTSLKYTHIITLLLIFLLLHSHRS